MIAPTVHILKKQKLYSDIIHIQERLDRGIKIANRLIIKNFVL